MMNRLWLDGDTCFMINCTKKLNINDSNQFIRRGTGSVVWLCI